MKKLLSLVLLFLIGCSSEPEPVNMNELVERFEGVFYSKVTNQPYTGPVFELYERTSYSYWDGKLSDEYRLENGNRVGPFTKYTYFEDGRYQSYTTDNYRGKNIRNGPSTVYYKNGQPQVVLTYKNDFPDGTTKSFYENGRLWSKGTFVNRKLNGPFTVYDENGKLIEEGIYEDGEIVSSKKYD